ncbi:anthranilate synthase component I family protein [Candidatus Peregrinibacteria bacterium]|nr:anthranilate synthase component I family protein [Candidatus Peregrinibacteria bacterium]
MKPYFQTIICDTETPVSLYSKLAQPYSYAFLLESAETQERIGRYSFIGFDPLFLHVSPAGGKQNPLEILTSAYEKIKYQPNQALPSLQAGFVGYFSYETVRHFEKLHLPLAPAEIPESIFFFPKNLLIFDHFKRTLTFIAYSKTDLFKLLSRFKNTKNIPNPTEIPINSGDQLRQFPKNNFENLVSRAKEKICAGETFQIVLSQEFRQKTAEKSFDIYRKLRLKSPSPYMYYLQYPDFVILGSSPETLVRTENDEIIIRPIAGTRRRGKTPNEDKLLEKELKEDPKEQAEHMMLVDLGRNDIGAVAKPQSVRVTKLMEVEKFSHVMHLVSEIRGKKPHDKNIFDVFKTAFPAGTLTGAPKIRAMEIIAKFEKQPRGIYGGAVGYFDLSGNMDFAIAIRTMVYRSGVVTLRAGAGIVYDSIPELENKECFNKAAAPLTALI